MKVRKSIVLVILSLTLFSTFAAAQIAWDINDADRAEFALHRNNFYNLLGDRVAVFFASYTRPDFFRWRQEANFYYLTGAEVPFATLIMDGRNDKTILFLPPGREGLDAIWDGEMIGPGAEAVALFGIDDIRPIAEFKSTLHSVASGVDSLYYMAKGEENAAGGPDATSGYEYAISQYEWSKATRRADLLASFLRNAVPGANLVDVSPYIYAIRRIKTPWEIERIEEASRLAGDGHRAAMLATKPKTMEYEIEAAATNEFIKGGGLIVAFGAIVASGPNSAVFHYDQSGRQVRRKDVVLMDFAPNYRYYCSDISRTWPVKGTFSTEQKKIYEKVLEIQKKVIAKIKPGESIRSLSVYCRQLTEEAGYTYYHGVSHYLGLSVHDVGNTYDELKEGCVITVEPGIYLMDKKWGVRIEDVVLVTKDGSRVLSADIPKEVDDIQELMKSNKKKK